MTVLGEGRDTLLSIHFLQDTDKWLAARILIYTAVEESLGLNSRFLTGPRQAQDPDHTHSTWLWD